MAYTNPANQVETVTVDPAFGLPTAATNVRGKTTTFAYDAVGRLTRVNMPNETDSRTFAYYLDGTAWPAGAYTKAAPRVQTTQKQSSTVTIQNWQFFDGLGRLRQSQSAAPVASGAQISRIVSDSFYDNRGLPSRSYFQRHDATLIDPAQPWAWSAPPAWGVTESRTVYDELERPRFQETYANNVLKFRYETQYEGDRVLVIPPAGTGLIGTRTWFDGHGNVSKVDELKPVSGQASTTYAYNVRGDLTNVTDAAGNQTTMAYDWLSRLTQLTDPDAGTSTYQYDNVGNLRRSTDATGKQLWTTYDNLDRPTTVREDNDTTGPILALLTYDSAGYAGLPATDTRRTAAGDYTVRYQAYDDRNRVTQKDYVIPANEGSLAGTYSYTYGYDMANNQTSITYPAGGGLAQERVMTTYTGFGYPYSTYQPNAANTASLYTYVSSTLFKQNGQLENWVSGAPGPGFQRSLQYDELQRVSQLATKNTAGAFLQNDQFRYDDAGNVKRVLDGVSGQYQCFTYDHRARLTHGWTTNVDCTDEASPNTTFGPSPYNSTWTYNDIGNITAFTTGGQTKNYTYPAAGQARPHAATARGTDTYGYNANGEMTSRNVAGQAATLAWTPFGELSSVTQGANVSSFVYDANGQRLIRREGAVTTLYLEGQELKRDAAGTITGTRYYGHSGEMVAQRQSNGNVYMLGGNHQGSVSIAAQAVTGTVSRQLYTPFGAPRGPANQLPGDRGFVGQTEDDLSGLVYLNARYYDASLMRFLSTDPLVGSSGPQSLNHYSYAHNSPVIGADPSGLAVVWSESAQKWMDDTNGALWDGKYWYDPKNGSVYNTQYGWQDTDNNTWVADAGPNGGWRDPETMAIWLPEDPVWIDPNGYVWTGDEQGNSRGQCGNGSVASPCNTGWTGAEGSPTGCPLCGGSRLGAAERTAPRGGATYPRQGKQGEQLANPPGVRQVTIRLPGGRSIRVDSFEAATKAIHEIKYYLKSKLRYTPQIKMYHDYAVSQGGTLTIHLNTGAKISAKIEELVNNGSIGLVFYNVP